uniref:Uncharacterized protein n=1 Tax=Oryza brachyantha TaxID=4533 RepID=J3LWH8_ORYBR
MIRSSNHRSPELASNLDRWFFNKSHLFSGRMDCRIEQKEGNLPCLCFRPRSIDESVGRKASGPCRSAGRRAARAARTGESAAGGMAQIGAGRAPGNGLRRLREGDSPPADRRRRAALEPAPITLGHLTSHQEGESKQSSQSRTSRHSTIHFKFPINKNPKIASVVPSSWRL